MIKLAIVGFQGRMGKRIMDLAFANPQIQVTALIERPEATELPGEIQGVKTATDINAIRGCDVLIDFTAPEATMKALEACLRHRVRMVIGTTGLTAEQDARILTVSRQLGVVRSANMSVGVNVLFGLLRKMTEALKDYEIVITETHHVHKKDAPSGTAKTMAEVIQNAGDMRHVPITSLREGEVVGYHKVTFDGPVDTITLSHNAKTRDMFAEGALLAAKFVAYKDNGLYNMQDVLGLS